MKVYACDQPSDILPPNDTSGNPKWVPSYDPAVYEVTLVHTLTTNAPTDLLSTPEDLKVRIVKVLSSGSAESVSSYDAEIDKVTPGSTGQINVKYRSRSGKALKATFSFGSPPVTVTTRLVFEK